MTQRRQPTNLKPTEEASILKHWNSSSTLRLHLVQVAKYFANARTAEDPLMTDIDCAGFGLCYNEYDADTGKLERMNMRIQYDRPVENADQIQTKLEQMIDEAKTVLSLKPKTDYVSPGASLNEKEFTMPPPLHFIYAAIGWAILYSMAYVDTVPTTLEFVRGIIGGHQPCANLLFAIFIIHAIEAVATVAIGIWAEFTLSNILKWWFLTHIFGFATLGPVVRIAFRRRADLDAKDDIQ
ncbi:hypothetical protein BASA50_006811 [Batrachochytrium salamandrivorans]|uniref:DUF2470 domain-containing protein n=1 Tax=Batrachochytrium salamandrivorans TaxID=1357716 RepID=A0ABQ8FA48_9FUNG|nr:hypothetical protein BASA50_006811 [Batrachochytrium salamandrivorans]KAJ1328814.1 hypothetical protein BSLG_009901 [Batrachochytrium salamandrivorans]